MRIFAGVNRFAMLEEYLNKIINGDCLDVLHKLPDSCIDVVVTSHEDSAVRLKKHAETIKSKILEEYRK